jgi:O-antigen ligase
MQSLLILIALATIFVSKNKDKFSLSQILKEYWPLHLAMAGPFIAVLLHSVCTSDYHARDFEYAFRLALFPLVFSAISIIPLRFRQYVQWSFVGATLLALIKIIILTDHGAHRYGTDFIPIIFFALLSLLTGTFSLYAYYWGKKQNKATAAIAIISFICGLYVTFLSQSRGVWLAIPAIAIILLLSIKTISLKQKFACLCVALCVLGGALSSSTIVKQRLSEAQSDLQIYTVNQKEDTSIGIRFQLWQGSWLLFKEHPLFGVGISGFKPALAELANRNIISKESASHPHSHNEILFMMSQLGIFGLLALLGLYFVPAVYFIKWVRDTDAQIRAFAASGLALCIGFMILGFTDVVFLWREAFPFYSISIAFFLTSIMHRKKILKG